MPFPLQEGMLRPEIVNSNQGIAVLKRGQVPYFIYGGSTLGIDVADLFSMPAHHHFEKCCLGANETWLAL